MLEATSFGASSTTDEVLSGDESEGQTNSRNGRLPPDLAVETAPLPDRHGASGCRCGTGLVQGPRLHRTKCKRTLRPMRKHSNWLKLDLANLKSVRACADGLLAKGARRCSYANAGVMATPFGHTADGFERSSGRITSATLFWSTACVSYQRWRAAHQLVFFRPSLRERGPGRSQL